MFRTVVHFGVELTAAAMFKWKKEKGENSLTRIITYLYRQRFIELPAVSKRAQGERYLLFVIALVSVVLR